MDFKQDMSSRSSGASALLAEPPDATVLYRRAMLTKIRLRQAIFRARHLMPAGPVRRAV